MQLLVVCQVLCAIVIITILIHGSLVMQSRTTIVTVILDAMNNKLIFFKTPT